MRLFIGVDPGAKGGIAVLEEDGGIYDKGVMPLNSEGIACERVLWDILRFYVKMGATHSFLERVGPHALGTKQNTWTFALNAHTPRVVLSLLGVPPTLVETKDFMKTFSLAKTKEDPKPSRKWVKDKYGLDVHDGISDAICIAEYGRLLTLGEIDED